MNSLSRNGLTRSAWVFFAAVLAVLAWHYLRYLLVVRPDVAYMDTLRLLIFYDEIKTGSRSLFEVWAVGAHRGLISQALLHLNADLFGLNILGANAMSGVVLALTAVTVWICIVKDARLAICSAEHVLDRWSGLALALVVLFAMFSLASFELFTLDLGLALFVKNLTFIVFWYLLARLLASERASVIALLIVTLCGMAILLLVAMGWSYAFFLGTSVLVLDVWRKSPFRSRPAVYGAVVLLGLGVAMLIYVAAGGGVGALSGFVGGREDQALPLGNVIKSIFVGASAVFMGGEVSSQLGIPLGVQMAAGALLLLGVGSVFVLRLFGAGPRSGVPYALMAYALGCIFAVAVARGRVDPEMAKASRYYMDFGLLLIGMCWAAWLGTPARSGLGGLAAFSRLLAWCCVVLFVAGQSRTQWAEWEKAPYRAAAFSAMREATLSRRLDQAAADLLQATSLDVAVRGVEVQYNRRLSLFRTMPVTGTQCTMQAAIFGKGWYAQETHGRWMAQRSELNLSGCEGVARMSMYIPESFEPAQLTIEIEGEAATVHKMVPGQVLIVELNTGAASGAGWILLSLDHAHEPSPDAADQRQLGLLLGSLADVPAQ